MTAEEPRVLYETRDEGRIAVISMARERYRNPLSQQMMGEIEAAFERGDNDSGVRVIVLRGLGPAFSGGHDLGSPDALATREQREGESMGKRYPRTRGMDVDPHLYIRNIPKATIAMVHGTCVYASWMLASACDIVFAADDSRFLATNFAYFSVPWDIGARRAKHMMFEGRFIDAPTAVDYGFVSAIYPQAELEAETMAYAARVAEQDPFQLRMMKHSINQMQEIQGFTPHVYSSFSDRMVRAANTDAAVTVAAPEPGKRRLYVSVERALKRERDES